MLFFLIVASLNAFFEGAHLPGVVHGDDGGDPPQQLQASLAGFGKIHKGAEQQPVDKYWSALGMKVP